LGEVRACWAALRWTPHNLAALAPKEVGEAEVADLAIVGVVEQHILKLQVAVYDALVVHILHLPHVAWIGVGKAVDDMSCHAVVHGWGERFLFLHRRHQLRKVAPPVLLGERAWRWAHRGRVADVSLCVRPRLCMALGKRRPGVRRSLGGEEPAGGVRGGGDGVA